MKLVSFRRRDGSKGWGLLREQAVIDGRRLLDGTVCSLRQALARFPARGELSAALAADADAVRPDIALADLTLLPVLPDPAKIFCVGLNYRSHAAEAGRAVAEHPSLFIRLADTLVGHGAALVRPALSAHFDYEGELAVVIGKPGRHIAAADALDHVAGYSCFNDGSLRDYQKHSVTAGKNFHASAGFGPWLVTADEVADPAALEVTTRLNGAVVQQAPTAAMLYSIPQILAYISGFTPLAPGDVIATGTPDGVGALRSPPLWLKPGDVVEVAVSGIGTLRNPIAPEAPGRPS